MIKLRRYAHDRATYGYKTLLVHRPSEEHLYSTLSIFPIVAFYESATHELPKSEPLRLLRSIELQLLVRIKMESTGNAAVACIAQGRVIRKGASSKHPA